MNVLMRGNKIPRNYPCNHLVQETRDFFCSSFGRCLQCQHNIRVRGKLLLCLAQELFRTADFALWGFSVISVGSSSRSYDKLHFCLTAFKRKKKKKERLDYTVPHNVNECVTRACHLNARIIFNTILNTGLNFLSKPCNTALRPFSFVLLQNTSGTITPNYHGTENTKLILPYVMTLVTCWHMQLPEKKMTAWWMEEDLHKMKMIVMMNYFPPPIPGPPLSFLVLYP